MHKVTLGTYLLVRPQAGLGKPWKVAKILEVLPHSYRVQLEQGGSVIEVPKNRTKPHKTDTEPSLAAHAAPLLPRAVPKPPKRVLDHSYLVFVRTRPCCGCGVQSSIEAHHFGERGTGRKAHDYLAVPCCSACHHQFHATGTLEKKTRLETEHAFYKSGRETLVAWLLQQKVVEEV